MDGFLEMGGYGAYVWPAYVVSATTVGALSWIIFRRAAKARRRLAALERDRLENQNE